MLRKPIFVLAVSLISSLFVSASPAAQTLGPDFTLGEVDEESLDSFAPAATFIRSRNEFVVFYLQEESDAVHLLAQAVGADGQALGEAVEAVAPPQALVGRFAVAYSPQSDAHLVVWEQSQPDGSPEGLSARVLDSRGQPGGPTISLAGPSASNPSLAYDPYNQRFLAVWEIQTAFGRLGGSRFLDTDGTLGDSLQPLSGGTRFDNRIAFNAATGIYLWLWLSGTSDIRLRGQFFHDDGAAMGSDFDISAAGSSPDEPSVAANTLSPDFLVSWEDAEGESQDPQSPTVRFRRIGPERSRTVQLSAADRSASAALRFFGRTYAMASVVEDRDDEFDIELRLIGPGIESGDELAVEPLTQTGISPVVDQASQPQLVTGAGQLLVLWVQDRQASDDLQVRGRIIADPPAPASGLSFAPEGTVDLTPAGLLERSTLHGFERTTQIHLMDDDLPVTRLLEVDRGNVDVAAVSPGEPLYQSAFSLTIEMGGAVMEAANGRIDYIVRAKSGDSAIMDGLVAELEVNPMILAMVPSSARDIPNQLAGTAIAWASVLPREGGGLVLNETFQLPLQLKVSDAYRAVAPQLAMTDTFLELFYRTPDSGGLLRLSSSVLSLRGRSESAITLEFEVQGDPPPPEFVESLHFAQFGGGGGLASQLILSNPAGLATVILLEMRDQNGDPLALPVNGTETEGTLQAELPAGGVRIFQTDPEVPLQAGSLTVRSEHPIGGVVLFGGQFGLAGVGSSQPLTSLQVPVEVINPTRRTGLAVHNLASEEVQLDLTLTDEDGLAQAAAQVVLPPLGQISLFTDEIEWDAPVDFSSFLGQIIVNATGGEVAATAIQVRPGQFASLPVLPRPEP